MLTTKTLLSGFTPHSLCFNDLLASSEKATLGFKSCEDDLEEIRRFIRPFVSKGNLTDLPDDILSQWLHCMVLDDKTLMAVPRSIRLGGVVERSQPFEYLNCRKVAEHRQSFLEAALQVFKTFETTGMAMIAARDISSGEPMDSTLKQQTDAPLQSIREIIRHLEVALEHNRGLPGVFSTEG